MPNKRPNVHFHKHVPNFLNTLQQPSTSPSQQSEGSERPEREDEKPVIVNDEEYAWELKAEEAKVKGVEDVQDQRLISTMLSKTSKRERERQSQQNKRIKKVKRNQSQNTPRKRVDKIPVNRSLLSFVEDEESSSSSSDQEDGCHKSPAKDQSNGKNGP